PDAANRHPGLPGFPRTCVPMRACAGPGPGVKIGNINQGSTAMSTFVDRHRSDFNFNNNGSLGSFGDILWRDHAGHNVLWLMNNNTAGIIAPLPAVPPDWHVKAADDFDSVGSGNADILWQNDNGAVVLWQMNAHTVSAIRSLPNPGPTWHVVGDNN